IPRPTQLYDRTARRLRLRRDGQNSAEESTVPDSAAWRQTGTWRTGIPLASGIHPCWSRRQSKMSLAPPKISNAQLPFHFPHAHEQMLGDFYSLLYSFL